MADMSRQVLGGKWGKCFVTVGDETFDLITLKNVEIKYDKSKSEVNQLNDAVTKHKTKRYKLHWFSNNILPDTTF